VNRGRETGDDNGGYILQREFSLALVRSADELTVTTGQRALWGIDADDVVRHGLIIAFNESLRFTL